MTDTVSLTIDGQELSVPKGTLVIRAAEQLGITVPRFCDHPLLDPVGACRQCMVEVEGQRKPFTACTTTCTEGMVVKTHLASQFALDAQEAQLEFLLLNHPLDCPQCDKGGECPLQDQTLAHGPPDSRFIDDKRRYAKAVPISEQIALDRERCVLCARCTRFSQQISGDPFIELFERGALEQVAIYEDEPYHSYFSGNVVQICPVGALTATSYRFKARPFDLQSSNSICNQCSAGCNFRVDVRRGAVTRQLARDNLAVNESWSCDKGRFAFEYLRHESRLREPVVRDELGSIKPATWLHALRTAGARLAEAAEAGGVGVITGGRLTDEDSYALSRFARDVLATDNVDFRLAPRTDEERDILASVAGTVGPSYDDVEAAPLIVIAGLAPEEEVPILHLRLRKAWRKHRRRVVVVGPTVAGMREYAWRWIPTAAGAEAETLRALTSTDRPLGGSLPDSEAIATNGDRSDVAEALRGAGSGVVVLAGERLAQSPGALRAAADLAGGLGGRFAWVPRRNGARGAVDAGLVPGLLPGGRRRDDAGGVADAWNGVPDADGMDTAAMLRAAAAGELQALYLVGVDPVRDFEDPALARRALEEVGTLVVQDLMATESSRYADVLLPAAAPQERVGSFTTWEGRRQPFAKAVVAQGLVQEDWDILRQLATVMGHDLGWETADDVRREAAALMDRGPATSPASSQPVAGSQTASQVSEGELAAVLVPHLLGDSTMLAGADALKATARPLVAMVNETDARRLGLDDGATCAVTGPNGRVELPVRVTADVARGAVVLPARAGDSLVSGLGEAGAPLHVRVEAPAAVGEGE